jgi:HEPN domain-containing protein
VSYQWEYRPWMGTPKQTLKADDVLDATMATTYTPPKARKGKAPKLSTVRLSKLAPIRYADQAYVAARMIGLTDQDVHLASLYFMGQAMELYLKALLLHRLEADDMARAFGFPPANAPALPDPELKTHDLVMLAQGVGQDHPEFLDPEFIALCERLTAFQEAGRYPDHWVQRWVLSLSRVTFLDSFVAHCREIMDIDSTLNGADLMRNLFTFVPPSRPASAAQQLGVLELLAEENDYLPALTGYSQERLDRALGAAKSYVLAALHHDGSLAEFQGSPS